MKIIATAIEILKYGDWDAFCEANKINPWAMKEGLMESTEDVSEERKTPGGIPFHTSRVATAWERWKLGKLELFATAEVWIGQLIAEPMDGGHLSEATTLKVAHLLRERTPEERAESARRYNEAAERMWGKLLAHSDKITTPSEGGWRAFKDVNPQAQQLAYEVDAELNYELSYAQCSWAVAMFCGYDPKQYEAETGIKIEARP